MLQLVWAQHHKDHHATNGNWAKYRGPLAILSADEFAEMIDRHWDGVAAYCTPDNKVSLGFVEGLNDKIRVIQRRPYGLRDEDYLRLKIRTCMLPRPQNDHEFVHTTS